MKILTCELYYNYCFLKLISWDSFSFAFLSFIFSLPCLLRDIKQVLYLWYRSRKVEIGIRILLIPNLYRLRLWLISEETKVHCWRPQKRPVSSRWNAVCISWCWISSKLRNHVQGLKVFSCLGGISS